MSCGSKYEDRKQKENAGLMEAWSYEQYAGETERETHRRTLFQKLLLKICACVCVQCTRFIQVLTRTDRSQCSLRAPTLTPKYIPSGISFFASSRHPVLCAEPAYPIGTNRLGSRPNRSVQNRLGPRLFQPIRPMLSLYLNNYLIVKGQIDPIEIENAPE